MGKYLVMWRAAAPAPPPGGAFYSAKNWVGNCPTDFRQNKKRHQAAARRQRRAILLLAHPVLGSHLHPWLKLSTKIIRNNPFIPPYCHQFLIHCQVFHLKKRRQKSRKCLLFASSTTVSRDFGKWAIAIPLSSVFRLNYLQKKKKNWFLGSLIGHISGLKTP